MFIAIKGRLYRDQGHKFGPEAAYDAGLSRSRTRDLGPKLRELMAESRRLPRVAMETLVLIALHQPVTRAEVEEIRGVSLSQTTMDLLLKRGLVKLRGRK